MDISVITFTMGGRDNYLQDCVVSVINDLLNTDDNLKIEHHIILQGCPYPQFIFDVIANSSAVKNYDLYIHEWRENIGIGAGLNKITPQCNSSLIMKMDDDCKIISRDFFGSALALHRRFPNSVFSPFPVGLIRSLGGVPAIRHSVWNDKRYDKFYTRRHVNHVGGFARFAPTELMKQFTFPSDLISGISGTEDGNFSSYCNSKGIEMFYLENEMIVEHNESGLGQIIRYPDYFSGRSWESTLKIEVLE